MPVDRVDPCAVRSGGGELLGLEVGRAEHGCVETLGGCPCRDGAREVPGRRARQSREAELLRLRSGDCDDAILEGVRGIGRVELEPELPEPELVRQAIGTHERRKPRRKTVLLGRLDRQ